MARDTPHVILLLDVTSGVVCSVEKDTCSVENPLQGASPWEYLRCEDEIVKKKSEAKTKKKKNKL